MKDLLYCQAMKLLATAQSSSSEVIQINMPYKSMTSQSIQTLFTFRSKSCCKWLMGLKSWVNWLAITSKVTLFLLLTLLLKGIVSSFQPSMETTIKKEATLTLVLIFWYPPHLLFTMAVAHAQPWFYITFVKCFDFLKTQSQHRRMWLLRKQVADEVQR